MLWQLFAQLEKQSIKDRSELCKRDLEWGRHLQHDISAAVQVVISQLTYRSNLWLFLYRLEIFLGRLWLTCLYVFSFNQWTMQHQNGWTVRRALFSSPKNVNKLIFPIPLVMSWLPWALREASCVKRALSCKCQLTMFQECRQFTVGGRSSENWHWN